MLIRKRWKWGFALLFLLTIHGCGYYFPHVYEGANRVIYMPTWQNRTNKLGLDMKIYQSLARWFQKSESVALTKEKNGADLILAGEILSIDLPTVSWKNISEVTGTKITLNVRYVLKDQKNGKILWEVPSKLYTADYTVPTSTLGADDAALAKIIDDMSEDIYLGTLNKIRKQHNQQTQTN